MSEIYFGGADPLEEERIEEELDEMVERHRLGRIGEAAMRAQGRRYRPPQSETGDPYVLDHGWVALERQRRAEKAARDINRLTP